MAAHRYGGWLSYTLALAAKKKENGVKTTPSVRMCKYMLLNGFPSPTEFEIEMGGLVCFPFLSMEVVVLRGLKRRLSWARKQIAKYRLTT